MSISYDGLPLQVQGKARKGMTQVKTFPRFTLKLGFCTVPTLACHYKGKESHDSRQNIFKMSIETEFLNTFYTGLPLEVPHKARKAMTSQNFSCIHIGSGFLHSSHMGLPLENQGKL